MNLPYAICNSEYIYSSLYNNMFNVITFITVFQPYYKLVIYIKFLPIFKSILPNTMGLNITAKISDNATNTYTTQQ